MIPEHAARPVEELRAQIQRTTPTACASCKRVLLLPPVESNQCTACRYKVREVRHGA